MAGETCLPAWPGALHGHLGPSAALDPEKELYPAKTSDTEKDSWSESASANQDSDWCGRNSCTLVLTPSLITPHRLGSPFSSALAAFFICSKVACGGIGGTSGAVRTSITAGPGGPPPRGPAGPRPPPPFPPKPLPPPGFWGGPLRTPRRPPGVVGRGWPPPPT